MYGKFDKFLWDDSYGAIFNVHRSVMVNVNVTIDKSEITDTINDKSEITDTIGVCDLTFIPTEDTEEQKICIRFFIRNDNLRYLSVKPNASISVLRQKIWHLLVLPDFCEEVIVLKSNDVEIPLTELRKGNDPQKPFILEVWPPNNLQTFKPNMLTMGSEIRSSGAMSVVECEHKSQAESHQDFQDIESTSVQAVPLPTKEVNKLKQKCPMNTLPPEYKNSELSCKISTSSLFFKLPGRRANRDNFGIILLKIQDDLMALSNKLSTLEDKIRS